MSRDKKIKKLLNKTKDINKLDLSLNEDLSIGIMNLIAIEEHLFHTYQKTNNNNYLNYLNEVRLMRTELLKEIITDYEGEVWCISKHLLAASMRLMEVGTKHLKENNKKTAQDYFDKSYSLYALFWDINSSLTQKKPAIQSNKPSNSLFTKLKKNLNQAIDCCRE